MKIITVAIRKQMNVKVIGGNSRNAIFPPMNAAPQNAAVSVIRARVIASPFSRPDRDSKNVFIYKK